MTKKRFFKEATRYLEPAAISIVDDSDLQNQPHG